MSAKGFLQCLDRLHHSLRWRHNERDSVSNHQPHGCLLNGLLRRRSKKTSKLRVTGLCVGNSSGPVNSPHKGPVTRKMFPLMTSSCGSIDTSDVTTRRWISYKGPEQNGWNFADDSCDHIVWNSALISWLTEVFLVDPWQIENKISLVKTSHYFC